MFGESGCCHIHNNKLTDNRFFVIVIGDGNHTIFTTKIFREDIGVAAVIISANTIATLKNVKIIGVNSENIDGILNNLAKDYSTNIPD